EKFSLLSIKLSGIKACNKHMGLYFTNKLLKKVYHIIKNCTGPRAYIARKKGGYFSVLLKDSDVTEINSILRVLHYSIAKGLAEEKVDNIINDAEIGMSCFPEDGADIWGLLDKAGHMKINFQK
ncbi:MAG: diguanylate cyclase, partial [Deltaproteobacteria bacterium]